MDNIAISKIHGVDYHCIITGISKSKTENLLLKADLNKKSAILSNIKKLFSHIKLGKEILKFGDIEIKKKKIHRYKSRIFLENVDIVNTLLVTCIMITKLCHYI